MCAIRSCCHGNNAFFTKKIFFSKVDSQRLLWTGFQLAPQLISSVCFRRYAYQLHQQRAGCACRGGVMSGAGVHQFVNELLASCCSQCGQLFVNGDLCSPAPFTEHKPYVSGLRLCQNKSGDALKKVSYHGYKNCPHHICQRPCVIVFSSL